MKNLIITLFAIVTTFFGQAQFQTKSMTLKDFKTTYDRKGVDKRIFSNDLNDSVPTKNKSINIGLCLGYNFLCKQIDNAFISPDSNLLRFEPEPIYSFVASTVIVFPIIASKTKSSVKLLVDNQGNVVKANKYSNGLTGVISLNLLQLKNAENNAALNYKLDGGIGLGYRFNDNYLFSVTYDLTSVLQPRDYLYDYKDKQLIINNNPLPSLNTNDPSYFYARYVSSISIRFAYAFVDKDL
jgi:hypothetical protein